MSTKVKLPRGRNLLTAAEWLDRNMPNPPLPDPQRWSVVDMDTADGKWVDPYVEFADEQDAIMFSLSVQL